MAQYRKRGTLITLDWLKSNCIENAATGCWEWQRCLNSTGYGAIRYQGRTRGTHCLAFELSQGAIPNGHFVLHECDNPRCCNPKHLFSGTRADNIADMRAKGRGAFGEKNGTAKLTSEQVLAIRSGTSSCRAKANQFGVSPETIRRVTTGQLWSHVLAA